MRTILHNLFTTLRKFRLASCLNLIGLSVAFAAFIVIMIQVYNEYTFDTHYENAGKIYRVESTIISAESSMSASESYTAFFAHPLAEMLLPAIPQIENYTLLHGAGNELYIHYENSEGEMTGMITTGYKVSETFPELFNMEMLEGEAGSLSEPGKILIPGSLSKKMFGSRSAIGQQFLSQPGNQSLTAGGVYKDFPENTSMTNDIKIGIGNENKHNWNDWTYVLFVTLYPDTSPEEVSTQLKELFSQTEIAGYLDKQTEFRLTPIKDIYYQQSTYLDFAPKGNRMMTHILLSIAFLVIIIATINFLNFSMALIPSRIKSINTRKILGSSTLQLRGTLLFEAVGIYLLSFLIALGWVWLLRFINNSSLLLSPVHLSRHLPILTGTFLLALTAGVVTGLYPAFYMTSFQPAIILKSTSSLGTPGGSLLRTGLIGFQFIISTGLIIAASFLWEQNRYVYHKEGLMNNNQIATITLDKTTETLSAGTLPDKLLSHPGITDVAFSEWPIGFLDYYFYTYAKSPAHEDLRYYYLPVSYNFTDLMELSILEGRGFDKRDATGPEERIIFNELAAKQFQVEPGDRLSNGQLVVGIVENFNFMNLRKGLEPMALLVKSPEYSSLPVVYIRIVDSDTKSIDHIRKCIAEADPLYPVDIRFYDQHFKQTYQNEQKTALQITLFSLLAILISFAGIFGMVTFETQYRRKEIGIRKVMGATIPEILYMLNRKFIRIVIICFVLAAPIAWYGISQWLQTFAYRTPMHSWIFIISFLIVLLVTLVTVTLQSWQSAMTQPVDSLKSE